MTPDPKLPPLREALERIAWRETPIHPRGPDDYTVYLPRHLVLGVAAPHDALIRQQEARIAEQDLRVAVLQESLRERDETIEGMEKENETFRTACAVANDQAEHVTSLFEPVEAEKDRLTRKIAELEAEVADANDEISHWRRLAVAARDALGRSGGLCGMEREQLTASQIINRLAEMPATEVELAMTSLGVARQNREDLAEFRELAREAAYVPKMYKSDLVRGDQYIVIAARLAALHKEE